MRREFFSLSLRKSSECPWVLPGRAFPVWDICSYAHTALLCLAGGKAICGSRILSSDNVFLFFILQSALLGTFQEQHFFPVKATDAAEAVGKRSLRFQ